MDGLWRFLGYGVLACFPVVFIDLINLVMEGICWRRLSMLAAWFVAWV